MRTPVNWGILPPNVVQNVCTHRDAHAFWKMRLVSKDWALALRQVAKQELTIPVTQLNLSTKLATLSRWRGAGRFCECSFTFCMYQDISLAELATVLENLAGQVLFVSCVKSQKTGLVTTTLDSYTQADAITSCTIDVRPRLHSDSLNQLQQADAENVAHFSEQLLSQHHLAVSISVVRPVSDDILLPSPDALSALRKLLRQFDTFSVPFEQPAESDSPRPAWPSAITYQHAKALQGSKLAVFTASLLNTATSNYWMRPIVHSIEYVGSMSCLIKLPLIASAGFEAQPVNFDPLAKLSLLEDLVLKCIDDDQPTCCGGVLASNRQTLRLVALSAPSWSDATYDSLQDLDHLEVCHVNTAELNIDQAQAFGRISAAQDSRTSS